MIRVRQMFTELSVEQRPRGLPDFIEGDKGWMTDVALGSESISFRTSWVPNLNVIHQIAEHYGLNYVDRYEEPNMLVFGEAACQDGIFTHVYIEHSDLTAIGYDNAAGKYTYDDRLFDDDFEIWIEILEDKKKRMAERDALFQSTGTVSAEELRQLFGELGNGDLFFKLAERKNFLAAEGIFKSWDEENVIFMDNYLIAELQHSETLAKYSRDEYIALRFLQQLLSERDQDQQRQKSLGR